jgi:uncharacterized protein (TIGR02453 family)
VTFAGFSRDALRFLEDLGENNDRAWFQANRERYDAVLLEPARDLVAAMGEKFDRAGIDVHAEPRVGGSIMRIARDTRFSRDKRPYKTHLDLWFWEGEGRSRESPGYWFRLTPQTLTLGAGVHRFEGELLDRYRAAVEHTKSGGNLVRAVDAVREAGAEVGGKSYKRLPRGYEATGARAELLLHGGLYAGFELALPDEVETPRFPAFCVERFAALRPLQGWLVEPTRSA